MRRVLLHSSSHFLPNSPSEMAPLVLDRMCAGLQANRSVALFVRWSMASSTFPFWMCSKTVFTTSLLLSLCLMSRLPSWDSVWLQKLPVIFRSSAHFGCCLQVLSTVLIWGPIPRILLYRLGQSFQWIPMDMPSLRASKKTSFIFSGVRVSSCPSNCGSRSNRPLMDIFPRNDPASLYRHLMVPGVLVKNPWFAALNARLHSSYSSARLKPGMSRMASLTTLYLMTGK